MSFGAASSAPRVSAQDRRQYNLRPTGGELTMAELHAEVTTEAPFPKGLLVWNYNDHEHVVGTHYKNYESVEILAEADTWCFSKRTARLPFIPLRTSALVFSYCPSENLQRSYHQGPFGLLLRQEFHFKELGPNRTQVT